jgi:hypothetical protein
MSSRRDVGCAFAQPVVLALDPDHADVWTSGSMKQAATNPTGRSPSHSSPRARSTGTNYGARLGV